jgi:hypothetical protein
MVKKSQIAAALEVDPANITRWAKRGMPLYSIDAARAWRQQNIRPRMKPYQPVADPTYAADDISEWFTYALERAAVEMVALLHVECDLPRDRGDVAFSCVATALSAALQEDLPDNDIAMMVGPTAPTRSDYDRTYNGAGISARIEELRADQPKETTP